MGPGSFVMVLIGCAQGQQCAPVMTMPIAYRSEASCLAERADILAASEGLGYDRLFAECRKRSANGQASAPIKTNRQKPIA